MLLSKFVSQLTVLLSYSMVILALVISSSTTLKQMIRLYQVQAWVLTVVVLLTARGPQGIRFAVALMALVPASLALTVRPLLGRASLAVPPEGAGTPAATGPRARLARLRGSARQADLTWLQHGGSRLGGFSAAVDMVLIAAAVLVAPPLLGNLPGEPPGGIMEGLDTASLTVSIALLLQGLFTMTNKRDIIAQIIGLLVMEHGLFLVAVRTATTASLPTSLATLFVISLFFYVLVTLMILVWILPELHRASRGIELNDNRNLKG